MWELDCKKDWELKNWSFQIVVLEKILESPLDCLKIKPVNPKGNQPWIFIGRTDAEAEVPILWPPDVKDSLERILMVGKITSKRGKQQQRMRCLDSITDSMHVNLSKLGDSGGERSLCAAVHGVTKSQARLIN